MPPVYYDPVWDTVECDFDAGGYRLPTEAEWEYACRAGEATRYNTGDTITTSQANFDNVVGKTTSVGSYAPNAWGLHDMHGNVWEWCWDWYGSYPDGTLDDDYSGAPSGSYRVLRGGHWNGYAESLRSASRSYYDPGFLYYLDRGFRLVRPVV